jgi:hypothetical protein
MKAARCFRPADAELEVEEEPRTRSGSGLDCSQSWRKPTVLGSYDLLLTSASCAGRVDLYSGFRR